MRMMSAEWLASGTNPVRLSAKGLQDRGRDDCTQDRKENRGGESRRKMMISVKILLPCDSRGFPRPAPHDGSASLLPCGFCRPVDDY